MDTRAKIVDDARAAELRSAHPGMRFVTGYFDVLVPSQVRTLERLVSGEAPDGSRPLMAVVVDPPAPLLNARARAELAAGLAVIDYVLLAAGGKPEWLTDAVSLEAEHEGNRQNLIAHVHRRQTG
ncbi:MAG: hypothetical protein EXQ52_18615 [Bryobacterales bacterium]|nr:hypothetical protein [Bryobacterales bacterium]